MAPVGGEFLGSWLLTTSSVSPDLGVFSLLLLIIISIFFTSLCSNCGRRSFDMSEPEVEKSPSALTKVAKLAESTSSARENPMIDDIINDELENSMPMQSSEDDSEPRFTPWRSHLGTQKQPDGNDDQGANPATPANQLLARLRDTADSTNEWVSGKETFGALSAFSAPDRHPEEEEEQPAPAMLDPLAWEG